MGFVPERETGDLRDAKNRKIMRTDFWYFQRITTGTIRIMSDFVENLLRRPQLRRAGSSRKCLLLFKQNDHEQPREIQHPGLTFSSQQI